MDTSDNAGSYSAHIKRVLDADLFRREFAAYCAACGDAKKKRFARLVKAYPEIYSTGPSPFLRGRRVR